MRSIRLVLCSLFCLTSFFATAPAFAQDGEFGLQAAIREGTCDDRGDRVAGLEAPAFQNGSEEGSNDGQSALLSVTTVDVPIEDLLDDDMIIAITREGQSGVDACASVGGVLSRRDVLVIQIVEVGDSGVWGIAILTPNEDEPDQTDIALYLGGEGLVAQEEPEPEPTATAPDNGDDDDDPNNGDPIELETYTSPTYGYSLAYDPEVWEIANPAETSEEGIDTFSLSAGFTTVYLDGLPAGADAQRCVEVVANTEISSETVIDSAPLEDENGDPIEGGNDSDAFVAYELTREGSDGTEGIQAFYVRCIVLVPGESVLAIRQYCAAEVYGLAAILRDALLDQLELP
jgi:hypothetical protein